MTCENSSSSSSSTTTQHVHNKSPHFTSSSDFSVPTHAFNMCSSMAATILALWAVAAALQSPIASSAAVTTTQGEDDITMDLSQSPSQAGRCLSHLRRGALLVVVAEPLALVLLVLVLLLLVLVLLLVLLLLVLPIPAKG